MKFRGWVLQSRCLVAVAAVLAAGAVWAHGDEPHGVSHGGIYEEGTTIALTIPGHVEETDPIQWYKDGAPLANGGMISGADAITLIIDDAQIGDSGLYSATYVSPDAGHGKAVPKHGAATFGPVQITVVGVGELPASGLFGLGAVTLALCGAGAWRLRKRLS